MQPGGVFPLLKNMVSDEVHDELFGGGNYASHAEHQEGAGEKLQRECNNGWPKRRPRAEGLERELGPMTFSRIGVIAKPKKGCMTLQMLMI